MSTESNIEQEDFQTGGVTVVSIAHAVHDTYTAFLPPLLPVLIGKFSMTNTAAGLLSVFLRLPSLLQPFIGHLADRTNLKLLIILAPSITGAAMSCLGLSPNYGFLIFLLALAGTSSACLHAIGPVMSSTFSGNKLGRGMSFWMVGGELGRALGPLITVTALGALSLEGLPWLMLAGILTSVFLFGKLKSISTRPLETVIKIPWKTALKEMRFVMAPLAVLVFARSLVTATLTTFLPTFLTTQGSSLWMAGASLTILQVSGMLGAFLAGALSDKFGRRRMLVLSFIGTPILMFLFLQITSLWQILPLIMLGFSAISITPVIMAIVMENFPKNRSFANGVYMAVSFIIGALAVLLVGYLSDVFDLRFTFMLSAGFLPLGLPFIFMLPKSQQVSKR